MSTGGVFNVPEPQGAEQVKYETTAAAAQVEAKTAEAARAVEANADQAQYVAGQAAAAAKSLGKDFTGEPTGAADQLKYQADAAAKQGQKDVEQAKVTGQAYVEQAKELAAGVAASVNATVQPYLEGATSTTAIRSGPNDNQGPGIVSQIQAGATVAAQTGKEYLAAAQQAAQPHIEKATAAAQNYYHSLTEQSSTATGKPSGVAATTAPLESGPHTVGTPYAATTGSKVGEVSQQV